MNLIKKCLNRVFVEGLSGMALGLFATLIIGTIIQQIGTLAGGSIGTLIYAVGKMAAGLTCAGIGVGVAYKFQESPMVVLSAATSGMIGGYASKVLAGTLLVDGNLALQGPGEPLGAFIAAYVGIEIGHLIAGKTRLDIILVPFLSIGTGSAVGVLVGPSISSFMTWLGGLINWGTEQQPFLMGIVVSVLMGMILTLPISSAALGVILNLSGLAAGAATVGCCCNMIGFAVASFRENGVGGLIAQGVGTSMLQVPNIVKKPLIWLAGDSVERCAWPGFINVVSYDEQCDRFRDGLCRLCWSDHDLAGDGTDGTSGCSIAEDCCDTVYAAGSSYSGIYTVYEKT